MRILFTTSDLCFSKLVRNITDEPVSHTAVELDCGVVVHSNWLGVLLEPSNKFRNKVSVIRELKPVVPMEDSKIIRKYAECQHDWYDVGAFFFLGISLMLRSKFGVPLPKSNLWQSTGMYLCTEWTTEIVDGKEDGMITPWKYYLKLQDSGQWVRP